MSNHQRLLEKEERESRERESRENNMVVLGIEESLDSEESENTLNIVNEFLESKMNITFVKAVQARRLGGKNPRHTQAPSRHRPILVIFQNAKEQ